jgi:hypothetical protein
MHLGSRGELPSTKRLLKENMPYLCQAGSFDPTINLSCPYGKKLIYRPDELGFLFDLSRVNDCYFLLYRPPTLYLTGVPTEPIEYK